MIKIQCTKAEMEKLLKALAESDSLNLFDECGDYYCMKYGDCTTCLCTKITWSFVENAKNKPTK